VSDQLEIARGAGNVSDLGAPHVAAGPLKSMLAARIAAILDQRKLTVRAAEEATGFAAADFSRIRRGNLGRFTVDRLLAILGALDPTIELSMMVRPRLSRGRVVAAIKAHEKNIRAEGATALYLYGSVARGEAGPQSDVDVFVEYDPTSRFNLLHLSGIKILLEDSLGVPIHITTGDSLKPPMKAIVQSEAVRVF
jgi:predicted nucleotidyltransferase/predicted XRE-type DNA-binding protein